MIQSQMKITLNTDMDLSGSEAKSNHGEEEIDFELGLPRFSEDYTSSTFEPDLFDINDIVTSGCVCDGPKRFLPAHDGCCKEGTSQNFRVIEMKEETKKCNPAEASKKSQDKVPPLIIKLPKKGTKVRRPDTLELVKGGENQAQAQFSEGVGSKVEEKVHKFEILRKRKKAVFSDVQRSLLKSYYSLNQRPKGEELKQISETVGHPCKVVKQWFDRERFNIRRSEKLLSSSNPSSDLSKKCLALDLEEGKDKTSSRDEKEGEGTRKELMDEDPTPVEENSDAIYSQHSDLRAILDETDSDSD